MCVAFRRRRPFVGGARRASRGRATSTHGRDQRLLLHGVVLLGVGFEVDVEDRVELSAPGPQLPTAGCVGPRLEPATLGQVDRDAEATPPRGDVDLDRTDLLPKELGLGVVQPEGEAAPVRPDGPLRSAASNSRFSPVPSVASSSSTSSSSSSVSVSVTVADSSAAVAGDGTVPVVTSAGASDALPVPEAAASVVSSSSGSGTRMPGTYAGSVLGGLYERDVRTSALFHGGQYG